MDQPQFNKTLFPNFTPALAASMKLEITAFFDDFVRENRPVDQLLTANFSYLDDNLAQLTIRLHSCHPNPAAEIGDGNDVVRTEPHQVAVAGCETRQKERVRPGEFVRNAAQMPTAVRRRRDGEDR